MNQELLKLMNVGPAVLRKLHLLGIETVDQLKKQSANHLYEELQRLTGVKHDPCLWDTFAAIIHEAKTGEKYPWWYWSKIRKSKNKNDIL
jgi:nucleotidyltransferase/DNA polymerase involved in DNA repair